MSHRTDDPSSRLVETRVKTDALGEAHKLHAPLRKRVRGMSVSAREIFDAPPTEQASAPWDAQYFGLDRVALFVRGDERIRRETLKLAAKNLFAEAHAIEHLGLAFCAKMSLLSETTEERMAYSLMAADEAIHLAMISDLSGMSEPESAGPFLTLLRTAIEEQPKAVLILLIQVILEGWGLTHYRLMAEASRDARVALALHSIVKDEAFHHGAGNVLFSRASLSARDEAYVEEFLGALLHMVRVGPQALVGALTRARGGTSVEERTKIFSELETEKTTLEKLTLLKGLLARHDLGDLVARLERRGSFTPLPPSACAQV